MPLKNKPTAMRTHLLLFIAVLPTLGTTFSQSSELVTDNKGEIELVPIWDYRAVDSMQRGISEEVNVGEKYFEKADYWVRYFLHDRFRKNGLIHRPGRTKEGVEMIYSTIEKVPFITVKQSIHIFYVEIDIAGLSDSIQKGEFAFNSDLDSAQEIGDFIFKGPMSIDASVKRLKITKESGDSALESGTYSDISKVKEMDVNDWRQSLRVKAAGDEKVCFFLYKTTPEDAPFSPTFAIKGNLKWFSD